MGFGMIPQPGFLSARRERLGDSECLVLEFENSFRPTKPFWIKRVEWVDPQKGFAAIKRQFFTKNEQYPEYSLVDETLLEVASYGNVAWAPVKWTKTSYRRNAEGVVRKSASEVITFDPDFAFNVGVDDSVFSTRPQSGRAVYDESLDMTYTAP